MQLVILRWDTCVVLHPYKIVTICRISILFVCCNVESHYESQLYVVYFLSKGHCTGVNEFRSIVVYLLQISVRTSCEYSKSLFICIYTPFVYICTHIHTYTDVFAKLLIEIKYLSVVKSIVAYNNFLLFSTTQQPL